jgi:glutathione S-transferase
MTTPILFYGVPSGCSFGSIVALEWLGLPYRLCRIDMPEVVSGATYRRINPVGETPTLLTADGRLVSESMAILNHLVAHAHGPDKAFAQGGPGFDRLNQMLAFLNTSYFGAFAPLWYAYESALDAAATQALRAYGADQVAKAHAHLETLMGEGPWLLGEQRSVADAYFAGIARWTQYHDVQGWAQRPALKALYQRLQDDPAVRFAHAIEHGEPAQTTARFLGEITLEAALETLAEPA